MAHACLNWQVYLGTWQLLPMVQIGDMMCTTSILWQHQKAVIVVPPGTDRLGIFPLWDLFELVLGYLRPDLGGSGPVLGLVWAVLGLSWADLGLSGAVLGLSWSCLGLSWGLWGVWRRSWGQSQASLVPSGLILGLS